MECFRAFSTFSVDLKSMQCFRVYSFAMLSCIFPLNAFECFSVKCFQTFSSGMLSGIFQRTAFGHIPVECFRTPKCFRAYISRSFWVYCQVECFGMHSSGILSGVFLWNAFGHSRVECFRLLEWLRAYPSRVFRSYYNEMLSRKVLGVFQWITFGRIPVECFWSLPVESFRALERRTGEFQWNADRFDLLAGSLKLSNFDDCF